LASKKAISPISYKIKDIPINDITVWTEAQARDLDKSGIKELAESIRSEGLQNPPLVQKNGPKSYLLMAGQRRLAALKLLNAKTIPALIIDDALDISDAKAVSIIENLHRKDMNNSEMAQACNFLAEKVGTRKAAKTIGVSSKTFRRYQGFAAVPDQLKEFVQSKKIAREDATRLYNIIPQTTKAVEIASKISKYTAPNRKRYLDALEENPNGEHSEIRRRANQFRVQENIYIHLTHSQAKGLAYESSNFEQEPKELVHKIITDWLARRGYKDT
jgi:ParB family chromosome partitioning protein